MYNNYLYLRRLVKELKEILKNYFLIKIYSQEKNKLHLHFINKLNENFFLIFSIDPQLVYLTIKSEHFPAKKNISFFFQDYLPSQIENIELSINDRIIKFTLSDGELYLIIHGNLSNAIFKSKTKLNFYKAGKIEKSDKLIKYLDEIKFTNDFKSLELNEEVFFSDDYKKIKKHYPFLSKELYSEMIFRIGNSENRNFNFYLRNISKEIMLDDIIVFYNHSLNELSFVPVTFSSFKVENENSIFSSYFKAADEYINRYYNTKKLTSEKLKVTNFLDKEIEKTFNKLNNITFQIKDDKKEDYYRKCAELLLLNRNQLKKGMEIIVIETESGYCEIKLNKKRTPQENIDDYFQKAKDFKIEFKQYNKLYELTLDKYNKLNELKTKLQNISNIKEMKNLQKEMGASNKNIEKKTQPQIQVKYRKYVYAENYFIYVGKDNLNNDLLTFKIAKQNDYWFHARGVAGSHVVLKVEKQRGNIPKYVLEKAASIAAFFSKAKNANLAPVSYTIRKYVQKRKGLEPGQVVLIQENTLIVKPQIPDDCVEEKEENLI
ncbi:MAG: DUF814 domain-containing protein [Ignavibacteriales bacterium]|nr:DUF814 domain-containing protein [Ignavibacteriales bacterium]